MLEFGHLCVAAAGIFSAWTGFRARAAKERFEREMSALSQAPFSSQLEFFKRQLRKDIGAEMICNAFAKAGGASMPIFITLSTCFPEGVQGSAGIAASIILSGVLCVGGAGLSLGSFFALSYGERLMRFHPEKKSLLDPKILQILSLADDERRAGVERRELSAAAKQPSPNSVTKMTPRL